MDTGKPQPRIVHRNRRTGTDGNRGAGIRINQKPTLIKFVLVFLYKNLYILGVTLLRRKNRMLRKIRRFFNRLRGRSYARIEKSARGLISFWQQLIRRAKAPFVRLRDVRKKMSPVIEQSRQDGKIPLRAYFQIIRTFARLLFAIGRTFFNHALPVAAAILLIIAVRDRIDVAHSVGLAVTYNDQHIGFIQHETVFEDAIRVLQDRFISDEDIPIVLTPQFTLRELEAGEQFMEPRAVADMIVRASGGEIDEGFGLYVDGIFLGAYNEFDPIWDELNAILDAHRTGIEGEDVDFVRSYGIYGGIFPLSSMRSMDEISAQLHGSDPNSPIVSYTVREGDTLPLLATNLGVSYQRLIELNPQLINGGIEVGQVLRVPEYQPFMPVKNIRTIVFPEEFPFEIDEIETITYVRGHRSIAVRGQPGVREVTARVAELNGVEISREILDTRILTSPVTQRVIVGTNDPRGIVAVGPVSSLGFLWPTEGGRITVGLGGYPGHTGVDIPRPAGTPIFASAAGTVVRAVNSTVGYGRHVVIDHHNGYTTWYAHMQVIHAYVGQRVNQGDVIGLVGSTGRSTGNHLHFEVRRHGRIMNPAHYITPQ